MPPDLPGYLWDALEAAHDLIQITNGVEEIELEVNRNLKHLIERKFEIIGEVLRRLDQSRPELFAAITDARGYINLRNIIAHNYAQVSATTLLNICHTEVDVLVNEIL